MLRTFQMPLVYAVEYDNPKEDRRKGKEGKNIFHFKAA